jgi:hypothetical protein
MQKRLKFDGISLINVSHVDKKNSILNKKKSKMFIDSIKFYLRLIEFMEGLIARKIDF